MTYRVLYADERGMIYEDPDLMAVGRSGDEIWELADEDMIPLPAGSGIMTLPGRYPIGIDPLVESLKTVTSACAVAAILPQGFTRALLPAYERLGQGLCEHPASVPILPLYGYSCIGARNGEIHVAAIKTDDPGKWDPSKYNGDTLSGRIDAKLREFPDNRILRQLARCSREYGCYTAQNIFYGRWEAGIPVARGCNARCVGCISLQPAECCPSPQARIDFTPSIEEIVEVAVPHLERAPDAIVSFGQGCEGEPLTQWRLISEAITRIRAFTGEGTINLNTNAGNTRGFEDVCRAGLDSVRVSLVSARERIYNIYHRPLGYSLRDVRASLKVARDYGVFSSLNLLVFPGLTDRDEEIEALFGLVEEAGLNMVQLRNLNIDPDVMMDLVGKPDREAKGIPAFIRMIREGFPGLQIGNYSKPL